MLPVNDPVALPGLAALAVGFFAFAVALLRARMRSRSFPKEAGGQRDNQSILWIMLQGVGIAVAAFGPIDASLDPLSPSALTTGGIVLILMIGAVALFDWSSRTMGRNWALVAQTRGDASLVTTGPFAYVRNPIYVTLGLFMVAMAIAYGHGRMLPIAAPIYFLGTWLRVRLEERVLRATFGSVYEAYAARVKRFIPGLF